MSVSKSRNGAGSRSSSAAVKSKTRNLIRAGLLGSTALVAVSLAATGAMAQTTVVPSPGTVAAGTTTISSGATLQLNNNSGVNYLTGTIFTGAGTLQTNASGTGTYGFRGQMNLLAGGLLDINTGTFNGSADGLAVWTSNLGSLNINAGARFDGVEGAIFVDALTGSGRLEGGFGGARTTTVGVNGGSGTFTGTVANNTDFGGRVLALTKAGAGTQSLLGTNSYTGITTVTGGVLALGGTSTMTGDIYVNGGVLRALNTTAFGSGTIHMINPTVEFGAAGTYANNFSLEVPNGQQAADPTTLNNTSGGTVTLSGRIYETAGVGGANQYVTFAGANTTILGNATNNWGGVTTVNSGVTLQGTTASISGGSIVNNGTLTYINTTAGTASQNISGTGVLQVTGTGAVTLNGAITSTGQVSVGGTGSNLTLGGARSGGSTTGVLVSGAGATLIVADGASIQSGQYNGVRMTGVGSILTNLGTIQNIGTGADGAVGAGVYVANAGAGGVTTVTNGSLTDTGAGSIIRGSSMGVRHEVGSTDTLVVNNHGHIIGDSNSGIESWASGGLTVNNFSAGYIYGFGFGIYSASSSANSVTNAGVIGQNVDGSQIVLGSGVFTTGALTLVNQTGGLIIGQQSGVSTNSSLNGSNAGTIRGTNGYGISTATGGSFTNSVGGQITGSQRGISLTGGTLTLTNAGSITGGTNDGITALGALTLTNTGTLSSSAFSGVAFTGVSTVTNSGTITGGNNATFGYGVQNAGNSGTSTITNQAGGLISGGTGSILLNGAGNTTIDLQAGSTTTGQILSTANGTHNVTIAGILNGAYNAATGSGVDNLTLAATGSMTSANLGAGNDSFTWQGGTFSGLIDGGSGTDVFTAAFGAGNGGTANVNNISNFETQSVASGTLTLTGSRSGASGWTIGSGAGLTVTGDLSNLASGMISNGGTLTIQAGGVLQQGSSPVTLNGAGNVVSNAGTVSSSVDAIVLSSNAAATVSNLAGGLITTSGANRAGVFINDGASAVINNSGTISGTNTNAGQGIWAESSAGALTVNNLAGGIITTVGGSAIRVDAVSGVFTLNNAGTLRNTGTIGSPVVGVYGGPGGSIVNSGTIEHNANSGSGIFANTAGAFSITNSGMINGGDQPFGRGIQLVGTADYSVTNLSGGTIRSLVGNAIEMSSTGAVTLDLQQGSTVSGNITSSGSGTRQVFLRGTLNGGYTGGAGVDNINIYSTATGSFTLDGGTGTSDAVNFESSGDSTRSGSITNFEVARFNGTGTVTLTGTNTGLQDFFVNSGAVSVSSAANMGGATGNVGLLGGTLQTTASFDSSRSYFTTNLLGRPGRIDVGAGTTFGIAGGLWGDGHLMLGGAGTLNLLTANHSFSGDIFVNGSALRAGAAGAFGTGTIHLINPTLIYGATGTYANNILLEVQSPASADPSTLRAEAGVAATLSGSIRQGTGAGVDPNQPLVIDGAGRIILSNTSNLWAGSTTINAGATLQGTTGTISGSDTVVNGVLHLLQPTSGTFGQDVSGSGTVQVSGLNVGQTLTLSGALTNANGVQVTSGSGLAITGSVNASNSSAVFATVAGASITNSGTITGNGSIFNSGVRLNGAGTITNLAGGTIRSNGGEGINAVSSSVFNAAGGMISGALRGIFLWGANSSVDNSGTISGGTLSGLTLNDGGSLINRSGGLINTVGGHGVVAGLGASTITNNGSIQGDTSGVLFLSDGSLTNTGTISSTSGSGIQAYNGSLSVTNLAGGMISGSAYGIDAGNAGTFISNAGTISGNYGVQMQGGAVHNLTGGVITGAAHGILSASGATAITNSGEIHGGAGLFQQGVYVTAGAGSSVNNQAGGLIDGWRGVTFQAAATDAVVVNAGTITGTGDNGVTLFGGGTVQNLSGGVINAMASGGWGILGSGTTSVLNLGTINADSGLATNGVLTLNNTGLVNGTVNGLLSYDNGIFNITNSGTISASSTTAGRGMNLAGVGNGVTNQAGGLISGWRGIELAANSTNTTLINYGTITGLAQGILSFAATGTNLTNFGTITGGNHAFIVAGGSGTVTNHVGGVMIGTIYNAVYGGAGSTIINAGLMTGGNAAVYTDGAGTLLVNTGTVRVTGSIVSSVTSGVYMSGAGGTVFNSGTIGSDLPGGRGVFLAGGTGAITNQSGGTISGNGNGAAILLTGAGYTLDMQAGSTVNGMIDASATTGLNTVTLAGALNGIYAGGSGSDVVTLVAGATFGTLYGQDGTDTLILTGPADASLNIGETTGFENRTMNGGGIWTLTGLDSDAADWTLDSGTLRLTGGQSVNDAAGILVNSGAILSVGDSEAIGALNGAGAVTIDASQILWVGINGTDSLFTGTISGAGSLSQAGSGTLTLSGANTYTGDTRVDAGTLRLGASNVIADTSRLIVFSGATLDLQGFNETVGTAALNGTLDGTGTLSASDYYLHGATVNANLGAGFLVTLGEVSVLNGTAAAERVAVADGTLRLGASERLSDSAFLTISQGATLDLNGFDETVSLAVISGTLNGIGDWGPPIAWVNDKSADDLIQVIGAPSVGTLTAVEYQLNGATINANLGTGTLYNTSGVSVLNGMSAASYVGVNRGTLRLGAANRLADTAALVIEFGATFDLGGHDETVGTAVISGTLDGVGAVNPVIGMAWDKSVDDLIQTLPGLSVGTLTAAEYQLNGAIINANLGTGRLFNVGEVSLLNGTSGAALVSVLAGTLRLGASDRLADTATLSVANGTILDLQAFDDTIALAQLNGTLAGTGTLTSNLYLLDGATVDANLGTGTLYNIGGHSVLTGTSAASYLGVTSGTLQLGAANRLADTATLVVDSGAAFDLEGHDETVGLAVISGTLYGVGAVNASMGGAKDATVDDLIQTVPGLSFGTLTATEYQLNGATIHGNLGAGRLFNTGGLSVLNGTAGAGLVSVQAGTLQLGASNRLADTATVSVTSGATLNLQAFSDTVAVALLNGTLAGTGTLSAAEYQLNGATVNANLGTGNLFNTGGVSVLNGTSGAGLVSVQAGTLRLGASERLADAADLSVSSGATFNLNGYNETVRGLFGMGDVTVGAGRLTFGGIESGFGGRLSGSGSVVHTGGLFTLFNNHTIQLLSNTGGELRFLGATTGNVSVSGGSMTGAGTIGGALTVSNGATLSPGLASTNNGLGGFQTGSLVMNGGRLALDVLGRSGGYLTDVIQVTGVANLTGGILAPNLQGPISDFNFSSRQLFLTAGTRVGTFANGNAFTADPGSLSGMYWRVRYDLVANGAVLELRKLVDFTQPDGTTNQNQVAAAISGGQLEASDDWANVISAFADLDRADLLTALNSTSGEAIADISTSMFSANDSFLGVVRNASTSQSGQARSMNFASTLGFIGGREGESSMVANVLGAFDPGAERASVQGGWISAYAGDSSLDGKPGQADMQTRLNGFAGGYAGSEGDVTIGLAAGVTRVEGSVDQRASTYESDLTHLATYMRFDDGVWAVAATGSLYSGQINSARTVAVGALTGIALGETDGQGQSLSASVSRRFQLDGGTGFAFGVESTASRIDLDGFTETRAGGLSLEVEAQSREWLTTVFSGRANHSFRQNGRDFGVYGGLGVMLTAGDRQAQADMRFSGAATGFGGFTVEGAETAPVAGVADFGIEAAITDSASVSVGYRGVFNERLNDHQIGARIQISW